MGLQRHAASTKQIIAFNVWGFAMGFLTIALYVAMRPRFGAGPATALRSGLFMWIVGFALANFTPVVLHLFPATLVAESTAVELVAVLLAALAGAWIYKEDAAASVRVASARA